MENRIANDLTPALRQVVTKIGLYLEQVRVIRAGKHSRICVIIDLVDGPGQVDEQQLEAASRAVSEELDRLDPLKGSYTLEVSTAGAQRELTTPRLYRRVLGKKVAIVLHDGTSASGRLLEVGDNGIILECPQGTCNWNWNQISQGESLVELVRD